VRDAKAQGEALGEKTTFGLSKHRRCAIDPLEYDAPLVLRLRRPHTQGFALGFNMTHLRCSNGVISITGKTDLCNSACGDYFYCRSNKF
jgi:hypothetical protein